MSSTDSEVSKFFDNIAEGYRSKYTNADPFLHYFFNERLEEAVKGLDFENATILDIGAGTGNLFDRICESNPSPDYYACDIAPQMLAESNIPASRRFVGACHEIDFGVDDFDIIYLLGVTTYLTGEELNKTLSFISSRLKTGGIARITFTNLDSADWKFRKAGKSFAKLVSSGKDVLGQNFQVYPMSLDSIETLAGPDFKLTNIKWLNHTVFPFYKVGKSLSVRIAKRLHTSKRDSLLRRLSSDFMVDLVKR